MPRQSAQLDLDNINFISDDHLQTVLARTSANPAQVAEAVRVSSEARLRALKIGLLLAAVLMIASFPASRLPNYTPGEIPRAGRGREMK